MKFFSKKPRKRRTLMEKFIQIQTKASLYDGPFDNVVGWSAAGMSDVIVTENGKLVVVDGGYAEDGAPLVEYLKNKAGDGVPEIEMWIVTHPHGDHYGAMNAISKDPALLESINVKKVVYWFPMEFHGRGGKPGILENANKDMERICDAFGAEAYRPNRDDKITVDGMEFHFLYVPDDCSILNTANGNCNLCSLIFTVQGKNKKVMVTGDAFGRSLQMVAWRYYRSIKSDILQMPHHALCDAYNDDFYRYTDPEILLMPISVAGYRAMHSELYATSKGNIINKAVEDKAKDIYKAFEGTVEIEI